MKRKMEMSLSAIAVPGLWDVICVAMIFSAPLGQKDQAMPMGPNFLKNSARLADDSAICPDLATVEQKVVKEYARHHRLTYGHGTDTDTRVMTPLCDNLGLHA